MESLKRALESIGRMWANLSATQRVVVSAAAAAMVILLVFGSVGTTEAWVRVAGPGMDTSAIQKKLQERGQKYEFRGAELYVPKQDADRIVLELAGEGTMTNNAVWKFLEQSDIFATRWDKEQRLRIALQTRLEGMIRSVESVKNAAVVINPGSTSQQLGFAGPKASASVQVELKEDRSLNRKNVQAIAGLVARAVTGVEEDQVLITDTKGMSYRAAKPTSDNYFVESIRDLARAREQEILAAIKESPFFQGASVVVNVNVDSKSSKVEDVTHSRPVVVRITERTVTKKSGSTPGGVRKGEGDVPVETPGRDEVEKHTDEENVVGTKKTTEENPAGDIQSITIGVLIPVEEGAAMTAAERELPKLRSFVLAAAGKKARMEDISVQLIPTKKPAPIAEPTDSDRVAMWMSAHWMKIVLSALALAALLVLLRVIQGNMAKDTVEELQALTTALTEEKESAVELGIGGEAAGDLGRLKQGLQQMVEKNPQGVAASLKSFMSGR